MNTDSDSQTDISDTGQPEKRFHGWRLVGIIMGVVVVLAVVSAIVDWAVIGPLEGRAF
jgi:hypothetical protein